MTARAGDALSHVYFRRPPKQLSRPFFKAIFQRLLVANQPSRFDHPHAPREGPASSKLNGSARICMGAMNLRHGLNPVPRSLLVATS